MPTEQHKGLFRSDTDTITSESQFCNNIHREDSTPSGRDILPNSANLCGIVEDVRTEMERSNDPNLVIPDFAKNKGYLPKPK